ncbi:unnamed protein product, partial [marine sediment metagenome]
MMGYSCLYLDNLIQGNDLVQIDGGHFGQFFMSLRAEGVAI